MNRRRILILAVLLMVAVTYRATVGAQTAYYSCDVRDLVRMVGTLVGEPNPVGGPSTLCLSSQKVCDLQRTAFEAQQKAELMFQLHQTYRACKQSGY